MNTTDWTIGIDLGGTKIEAAHVLQDGSVKKRVRLKTDVQGGPDAIKQQMVSMIKKLTEDASSDPLSIGIGIAGQIDDKEGTVRYAPNLNWKNVSVSADLQDELGLPVVILNDVRAAAWGEWLHGAGKNIDDMICIFIGTGVGGSIVSGGHMLSGASNMAGEIGHITIAMDGPQCHCGNNGCLEALAGSWAIERDAKKALRKNRSSDSLILREAGGSMDDVNATHTIDAYSKGDEIAAEIIERVIDALAAGLTGLTNALNPQRIIMGGGVTENIPKLTVKVESKLKKRVLDAAIDPLEIVSAELHNDSGVVGAASYALKTKNS